MVQLGMRKCNERLSCIRQLSTRRGRVAEKLVEIRSTSVLSAAQFGYTRLYG